MTSRSSHRGHPIVPEVRKQIAAAYVNGDKVADIQSQFKISESCVTAIVKEAKIPLRRRGRKSPQPPIPKEIRDQIAADYKSGDMTSIIARKFKVSADTVRDCAKEAGIPMRRPGGPGMPTAFFRSPIMIGPDPMDELTGIERLEVDYLRKLMARDARVWRQRKLKTEMIGDRMIGDVMNADGQRCS